MIQASERKSLTPSASSHHDNVDRLRSPNPASPDTVIDRLVLDNPVFPNGEARQGRQSQKT